MFSPARRWLDRFAGQRSEIAQRLTVRTGVEIIEWAEGETYGDFRDRVRVIILDRALTFREPGTDDDLVPAEADQA